MSEGDNKQNTAITASFMAFVSDAADQQMLRSFAVAQEVSEDAIHEGDVKTAIEYLKSHTSPEILFVEIASAEEAPSLLDGLADVCAPDTKVVVIGDINEYSFYRWLTDIGIASYILKPLTQSNLENAYRQSLTVPVAASENSRPPGKVITVIGARGGVGTSTMALGIAGVISSHTKKKVAAVDIDPYFGSIALSLDIDPSRGMREALENPDRLDALFMDRVVTKPTENLAILSSEEALHEDISVNDKALPVLMRELRSQFDYIVLDVPRRVDAFHKDCLQQADHVMLVTELSLLCLRDTLRVSDLMRERLNIKAPHIIVNRVGLASKIEMKVEDFEKGINTKLAAKIPFAPDVYMPISTELAVIKKHTHAAVKPLTAFAETLFPELKAVDGKKKKSLFKK